ncbi:MAG: NAD-dependent epimerase/dehydratase [Bacteroidetes bacterium]|nr:NAD-dependent epimerase/dehydratase [Bacteroidota bacterium]
MNVLITGGAGYIGTELISALSTLPNVNKIIVFDNLSRANYNLFIGANHNSHKISFIHGDILDSRKLRNALQGIDIVYHLAAKVTTPFANIDAHIYEQVNHWGTAELTYALEESRVTKFIFLSTAAVYGHTQSAADEKSTPSPDSYYSISKWKAEKHVLRLMDKMNTIILRLGNVYGFSKSMRFDAIINKFVFDAHFAGRITINGTGNQSRPFISIEKTRDALVQILQNEIPSGTYNLVDKNMQVLQIVETMNEIFPGMESFFINQNYTGFQLEVKKTSAIFSHIHISETDFKDELLRFKDKFAF